MTKKQHYMTYSERLRMEGMRRAGRGVSWIARELGFCRQTIYNELKRGSYIHTCPWWDEERYSAEKAQALHDRAQQAKGRQLKIGHDYAFANFLEQKILGDRYSPAAALAAARAAGFSTSICVTTLYSYIDTGVFLALTSSDLWEKPNRKTRKKAGTRKLAHPSLPSIEQRPEYINQRQERGHWEMDLVVGPTEGSSAVLLTLTERVTREEIILKLPNRKAATVRRAINGLERRMPDFRQRFKSISTDNGSEFMEYERLIRSVYGGRRFDVWYCHSYAAWEKGTNENQNRMIRRFFPKGTDFSTVTKKQIAAIQDWMNGYPRKILGWKAPNQVA